MRTNMSLWGPLPAFESVCTRSHKLLRTGRHQPAHRHKTAAAIRYAHGPPRTYLDRMGGQPSIRNQIHVRTTVVETIRSEDMPRWRSDRSMSPTDARN